MSSYLKSLIKAERVSIDLSTHHLYEELKGEGMPFSTMKDIFLAAAYFGIKTGKKKKLEAKHQIFQIGTFKQDQEWVDLLALALAGEKDIEIVQSGNALEVVEQFANGGIDELRDLVADLDGSIEGLVEELIMSCHSVVDE